MYIHHCEWAVSNNEHLLLKYKDYVSRKREQEKRELKESRGKLDTEENY